jgi:hypothetical protein
MIRSALPDPPATPIKSQIHAAVLILIKSHMSRDCYLNTIIYSRPWRG